MKLYLISQNINRDYDTYDSAIVCAISEEEAQEIHPSGKPEDFESAYPTWTKPKNVKVEYIGEAKDGSKKGVVLASFNAG